MKKWLKTIITIAVIILVLALLLLGVPALLNEIRARQIAQATAAMMENTVFARVDDLVSMVTASGTVRAEQSAVITWQTSGVVQSVLANIGDQVSDGDRLAELDPATLSQAIINANIEMNNAQKALDDLLISTLPAANAQLELVRAQQAYDEALEDRSSKDFQRVTGLTLDQLNAELLLAQNALNDAEKTFSFYADRPENDPVRLSMFSMLLDARRREERARINYNAAFKGPDLNEINEADAQLAVAAARLESAQREWERLSEGPAAEDIRAAEARIQAAEATLRLAYLQSTFNGTVTDVTVRKGDFVSPGVLAFRIDDLSRLYVDAYVLEIDINNVKVGQEVEIKFDAIVGSSYRGRVVTVSTVGERTANQVQFKVTIEILEPDEAVKTGMTADVSIITDRLEQVLLVPNQTLILRDDRTYIKVVRALSVQEVEIETGVSANSFTHVTSGNLNDGDELLLNLPAVDDAVTRMMADGPGGGFFGGGR